MPGIKQTAMLIIQRLVEEFDLDPKLNSVELDSYYEHEIHNITFKVKLPDDQVNQHSSNTDVLPGHIDFWSHHTVNKTSVAFMWRVGSSTNTHPFQGRIDRTELLTVDALISSMKMCPFLKQDK